MPAEAAIRVEGLTKTFYLRRNLPELVRPWRSRRTVEALKEVSLQVAPGELVSLLGPNGAGKTTLLKILAHLIEPSTGTIQIDGAERGRRQAQVGYVIADERSFFFRLSGRDNLLFFAALNGLPKKQAEERIFALSGWLGLKELLDRKFSELSQGQKQRFSIARGLLPDPPILLFDESTRALDPGRAAKLRRVIKEVLVARQRKAVIFATHQLDEAAELSDRAILMKDGAIDCQGNYRDIHSRVQEVFEKEAWQEDRALQELLNSCPSGEKRL